MIVGARLRCGGAAPGRTRQRVAQAAVGAVLVAGGLAAGCRSAEAQREPGWELRMPDRIELTSGTTAPLPIALAVDRGLTISKDAAVIVDLALEQGITVKKRRLGRGDAVDPEADAPRFAINIRADAPGDHLVRLHVQFWLCGTRTCRPIDVRRVATVAVVAALPADAGVDAPSDAGARIRGH